MKRKYLIIKINNTKFIDEGTILKEPCYIVEKMGFQRKEHAKLVRETLDFPDDYIIISYY